MVITISDNGPGIPDHERTVLEQGKETALEHSSGLGLWVIKWIINHNGGAVEIAEGESGGSMVTLTLPSTVKPGANQWTTDQANLVSIKD